MHMGLALKRINNYRPRRIKEQVFDSYSSRELDSYWSISRLGGRTYFVQHISQGPLSYFE